MTTALISVVAAVALSAATVESDPPAEAAIAAALDGLHSAATRADGPAYADRLDPDLVWIGADVGERWAHDAYVAFADTQFEDGEGWTHSARARRVWLAPDPCECLAWADEVLDSDTYGAAVGNAVMRRGQDGEWRVWRYALTYPIPNDLARGMTDEIKAWEAANPAPPQQPVPVTVETLPIHETLDAFHTAAANADGPAYFALFTPDAAYRGTDVTELWPLAEFRAFAEPYFAQGRGWTYTPAWRRVSIAETPCACVAWFDEMLESESYGTSRGTGVMVRGDDGVWRIAYYALTFPIPNALASEMMARIRAAAAVESPQ